MIKAQKALNESKCFLFCFVLFCFFGRKKMEQMKKINIETSVQVEIIIS